MAAKWVLSSVENINCLAAEVLCHILSLLPTKDAVRTSFVSRRWRVLLFHNRQSVVRFRLKCIYYNEGIGTPQFDTLRIDGWIRAVMWHSIQELELDITESDINLEFLPASLFTCETLVVLKLCLVSGYDSFEFPSKDVCGCPVLEDLILDDCCARYDCLKFEVSKPTVKRLIIRNMRYEGVNPVIPQIVINAPSLVYFSFSESELHPLVFVDMQSLCEAVIDFYFWFDSANYAAAINDLLAGITSVWSLQISIHTLECLQDCKAPIPLWSNMTRLKIFGWTQRYHFACLQYFLSRSYCLETLIIETIEILSFQEEEACMKMVEYFLSNAKVLEEMTIHIVAKKEQQLKSAKELPKGIDRNGVMEEITGFPEKLDYNNINLGIDHACATTLALPKSAQGNVYGHVSGGLMMWILGNPVKIEGQQAYWHCKDRGWSKWKNDSPRMIHDIWCFRSHPTFSWYERFESFQ
ncbi:hypothetical protein SLEP1_g26456 [Rubroshorea leprosula]|uniref:F-box domain-containing protein n=1 Tax=Rubroshorea leprosula TaxID=152421 RepID=A0AAV5JTC8_9ROSI|nr:hypothetical protein SLEP1_g26456 [Rubroshorea leprosula]